MTIHEQKYLYGSFGILVKPKQSPRYRERPLEGVALHPSHKLSADSPGVSLRNRSLAPADSTAIKLQGCFRVHIWTEIEKIPPEDSGVHISSYVPMLPAELHSDQCQERKERI